MPKRQVRDVPRENRRRRTRSEALLWELLRDRKLDGLCFRRQQPIGRFIVDFYCAAERLVVDIDGRIHQDREERDGRRQRALESLGLRVIRLPAHQVENDPATALAEIRALRRFPPLASPERGLTGEGAATGSLGYTLIELLIGLALSALLAAVVFELLVGQSRFARLQTAREEVQQNARVAIELLSSELRALTPAAIVRAEEDAIRYRVPRAWGLLCAPVTAASSVVWVRFAPGSFPVDYEAERRRWGVAVAQMPAHDAPIEGWRYVHTLAGVTGPGPCGALGGEGPADDRGFTAAAGAFGPEPLLTAVSIGALAFVYEEVDYHVALAASGASGAGMYWLRRSNGFVGDRPSPQPLVGPLPDTGGFRLVYRGADGQPLGSLVPPAAFDSIDLVDVEIVTLSRSRFRGEPQQTRVSSRIYLRN